MNKFYKIKNVFPSDKEGFTCIILTKATQLEAQNLKPFCSGNMNIKTLSEVLDIEKNYSSLLEKLDSDQTFFTHIKTHDYVSILITDDIMENDIKNRIITDLQGNYI